MPKDNCFISLHDNCTPLSTNVPVKLTLRCTGQRWEEMKHYTLHLHDITTLVEFMCKTNCLENYISNHFFISAMYAVL